MGNIDLENLQNDFQDMFDNVQPMGTQNEPPPEEKTILGTIWDTVTDTAELVADTAEDFVHDLRAYNAAAGGRGDLTLEQAEDNLKTSLIRRPLNAFTNKFADSDTPLLSPLADTVQSSELAYTQIIPDEKKWEQARKIQQEIGIPAETVMYDQTAWKNANNLYDEYQKAKEFYGPDMSAEDMKQVNPIIQKVSTADPAAGALIMADAYSTNKELSIIDTFNEYMEMGQMKLELDELGEKYREQKHSFEDLYRIQELQDKINHFNNKHNINFVDDPLAYAVAGLGGSWPEMSQSLRTAAEDEAAWMVAGMSAGGMAGSVVPGAGTAAGAGLGTAGGAVIGLARTLPKLKIMSRVGRALFGLGKNNAFRNLGEKALSKGTPILDKALSKAMPSMTTGAQIGAFRGMAEPEVGGRYLEYRDMKDEYGNPLMDHEEASERAVMAGSANAALEIFPTFSVFGKMTKGSKIQEAVISDVFKAAGNRYFQKSVATTAAAEFAKNTFKGAFTESGEEMLQNISDDLMLNDIEATHNDKTNGGVKPYTDIILDGMGAFAASFPTSILFGASGAAGAGVFSSSKNAAHRRNIARQEKMFGAALENTAIGNALAVDLQEAVHDSKLVQSAPDVQKQIIHEKAAGTGFETVYIDTEMALEKKNGKEDLKAVAKAANISDEDLDIAIESKGTLPVPLECFAQSDSSQELLESASYNTETKSIARMKKEVKETMDSIKRAYDENLTQKERIINTIITEVFPADENDKVSVARQDMAKSIIMTFSENPAMGWREMMKLVQDERMEIIGGALKYLQETSGNGVSIIPTEDGKGVRASNNAQWYSDFYSEYGRKPTKAELEDIAEDMLRGKRNIGDYHNIPEEELQATNTALDEINGKIKALDEIKDKMLGLTGVEMKLTETLSKEAYAGYLYIMELLKKASPHVSHAARMNAILFARAADIYAKKMNRTGRTDYTAKDYIDTVALRFGGQNLGGFNQGVDRSLARAKLKADIANWKKFIKNLPRTVWRKNSKNYNKQVRVMDTPLVLQICGIPNLPINIKKGKVNQIRLVDHPEMTDDILEQLPGAMTDPIAVVTSSSRPNDSVVEILSLRKHGVNIIVPVAINSTNNGLSVNILSTAFSKGVNRNGQRELQLGWFNNTFGNTKDVLYINRKKAQSLVAVGVQFPQTQTGEISLFVDKSIKHEEDLVNARNYNPTMYQMAGRLGASMLDREENPTGDYVTLRLDKAEEMENAGKSAEEIYKETGWLKGKDSKWRFEIPDNLDAIKADEFIREGAGAEWALDKLYENDKLYEAYPFLRKVTVTLSAELAERTGGNAYDSFININYHDGKVKPDELKKTLVHEIQHLIQEKEGFASGGGIDSVVEQMEFELSNLRHNMEDGIVVKENSISELYKLLEQHSDLTSKSNNAAIDGDLDAVKTIDNEKEAVEKKIQELFPYRNAEKVIEIYGQMEFLEQKIKEFHDAKPGHEKAIALYNLYRDLAGEQEARETAFRASMRNKIFHNDILNTEKEMGRLSLAFEKEYNNASEENRELMNEYIRLSEEMDESNNEPTRDELLKQKQAVEEKLNKNEQGKNLVTAFDDKWFAEWERENAWKNLNDYSNSMPRPHSYNAIVVFSGESYSIEKPEFNQGIKGSLTPMADGQRIITLFESADESTFLHEMGHLFLLDLENLAKIDKQAAKELAAVTEWAKFRKSDVKGYKGTPFEGEFLKLAADIEAAEKAGDVSTAEKLKRRWMHERFARGFEMYLEFGEAPSKGLKAVFRKFKQFLKVLYFGFAGQGVRATPEVERIMARMIASDTEIEAMALDSRYKDITKAGGEKLLGETEAQTMQRWHDEAKEEAKEKLMAIIMKDQSEEKKRERQAKIDKEREEVTSFMTSMPVYIAQKVIAETGSKEAVVEMGIYSNIEQLESDLEAVKDIPLDKAIEDHMADYEADLDKQQMDEEMTEEKLSKIMNQTYYHNKLLALETAALQERTRTMQRINSKAQNAIHEANVAIDGLDDDVEIKLEKNSPKVKAVLRALAKLRYADRWGTEDLQAIDKIINSSTKSEIAAALKEFETNSGQWKKNLKILQEAFDGQHRIIENAAKAELEKKKLIDACSYRHYVSMEKNASNLMNMFIRQGKWEAALRQQQFRLQAAAMAKYAKKNQEKLKKLTDKVTKQLSARTVKVAKDERYWHRHLAYLLGLNKEAPVKPEELLSAAEIFEGLNASLDIRDEDFKNQLYAIYEKISAQDFGGYMTLTMAELEEAVNMLTVLYTTGRDKFRMKSFDGKMLHEVVDEICQDETGIGVMTQNRFINPDTGGLGYSDILTKVPFIGENLSRVGQKYINAHIKPEELLKLIGDKAHKYIYGLYERAANEEGKMTAESVLKLKEILSAYTHAEKREWSKQKYTLYTGAGAEKVSKENIICMALNRGNETNWHRLFRGLRVDPTELANFIDENMTEKDWDTVQALWDHIGSYWEQTVKVEEKLNGVTLKSVEPREFIVRLPDGQQKTIRGGYYPIAYNPEKSLRAEEQSVDKAAQRTMKGAQVLGAGRGFTKGRSESLNIERPLRLSFDVIPNHLGDVIHNITYRIAARDVYRLVTSQKFEYLIRDTLGAEALRSITDWAVDCWKIMPNNTSQTEGAMNKLFGYFRRNATFNIMGYRMWPVIENSTNIFPMMDRLGVVNTLSAIGDYYAHKKECDLMMLKSSFMTNRINSMDRDIKSMPGLFDEDMKGLGWMKQHAYSMMAYSDLMLSAPLWARAYKDSIAGHYVDVERENKEMVDALRAAQAKVDDLNAQMFDLKQEKQKILEQLHPGYEVEFTPQRMRAVGYLNSELARVKSQLEPMEKALWEAEKELDKLANVDLMLPDDILKEAEVRAVQTADGAVRNVFGSGHTKDLAPIQKGGEFAKMFTCFYSFFNTQANAILANYYKGKFAKEELTGLQNIAVWMPFAKSVLFRIFLTSALSTIMKMAFGLDGDDDKDKYRKVLNDDGTETKEEIPALERFLTQYAKNTISTASGTMVGVRDVASLVCTYLFDGYDMGGSKAGSVPTAFIDKAYSTFKLANKKEERDAKIAADEERRKARYEKMSPKQKKKFDEELQYRHPAKRITYADIAKSGVGTVTSVTAAQTGITDTMANTVMTTMQYMADGDGRYDPSLSNIMWSAFWNKKPVEREIPEKPVKPKKSKKGV